ncbi:UNVERIFIED_CONTAM: Endoribonuclease Dicer4 [Sesamum radiatum]|uniref:Endoribonuclease Dicer4 n=1 Tax=Sesamum radiatum TaxID=300843 RepID=A0AAW2LC44_SESRA
MDDGNTTTVRPIESVENGICKELSTLSLNGDEEQLITEKPAKDPRRIARKYQIDLCKKALEENIVVYLETGSGKTHIAVLLIYEMGHLIRKPQKNKCIFLAPTVALVQQLKLCYQLANDSMKNMKMMMRRMWRRERGLGNMAGRDGVGWFILSANLSDIT